MAAGSAPLALRSDTNGSLIAPANRVGLYSLRVTKGAAPPEGIFVLRKSFDTIDGVAKSVGDLSELTRVLCGTTMSTTAPVLGHINLESLEGYSIGSVDLKLWRWPDELCPLDDELRRQLVKPILVQGEALTDRYRMRGINSCWST